MEKIKLSVTAREDKKPGQLRREKLVPATIYGPGQASESLQLDAKTFERLPVAAYSHVIQLEQSGKPAVNAVIRHVQRKGINSQVLHVEFYRVNLDRKLTMSVPLKFVGVSPAVTAGGQVLENFQEAEIECLPNNIPDFIEVDLSKITEIDGSIHFQDLKLTGDIKILNPPEETIVKVIAPRETTPAAPAAAAAAPAAGAAEAAPAPAAS